MLRARYAALRAVWLLPGALVVFLSFQSGGFFPTAPAAVAVLLALALAGRFLLVARPFASFGPSAALVAAALALFAAWTLLSAQWSHATGRALVEFVRASAYLLVFLAFAVAPARPGRLRWMLHGLAAGIVVVCAAAFITRALPDLWPIAPNVATERLSYPLSYWNALGLVAALGIVLALHAAASQREPRWVNVLGAAALPVLTCTLLLTFSRGAILVGIVGAIVFALTARPRGLLGALIAAGPTCAVALMSAYGADALATTNPTGPTAVAQGDDLARVVALCTAAAAVLRLVMLPLDARLARLDVSARTRRAVVSAAAVLVVGAAMAATLALDVPGRLEAQYRSFVDGNIIQTADPRDRLLLTGNSGRLRHWRVSLESYRERPLTGTGAGTYQVEWAQRRTIDFTVNDGHSLYLEVLGELGIVGLALVAVMVLTMLAALAWRIRGPDRALYAAAFAVALAWALHAGIDWDWEMPAATVPFFAVGGAALAAESERAAAARTPPRPVRAAVALGCLLLAVTPALVARSQLHLDDSVRALRSGECRRGADEALDAIKALRVRPEPYEVLAYCDVQLGQPRLAVQVMQQAMTRDPGNWELVYGLSLVRAAAGMDPRPAVRRALALNPHGLLPRQAAERFDTGSRRAWIRRARRLPLPL